MNLLGSCCVGVSPTNGCRMAPEKIAPIAVPSFGATEYMKLGELVAAGARHVLRNDGGIAGNVVEKRRASRRA